ncbi:MAG: toll/interleukin-1 receptor domain-containing protein [Methylococcales bacterium]
MEIRFPTDNDGFLSQECPSCNQQFKVTFGGGGNEPISFCPYCGHEGQECWFTKEQVNYIQSAVTNVILEPELKKLGHQFKYVGLSTNISDVSSTPFDADIDFEVFRFPCCNETVKADQHEKLFCIICGKEKNIRMSEGKKIFLSHKGTDKEIVKDFKSTLEILGFSPWIDEDAMPAGTALERGILEGMQNSCAVIFFITPSFKDEGFLETEVNYAIQEKRKKGNGFAIIALQFQDENGKKGDIPELLKTYVWKTPKTHLHALNEIVRALPITVTTIDWREGIENIVTRPKVKSTTTELSDEAKIILNAAAKGGGTIQNFTALSCGPMISANGLNLIPNSDPRTIALWIGGLEDLLRRRYVKDLGHKGEIFEITREGYQALDEFVNSAC